VITLEPGPYRRRGKFAGVVTGVVARRVGLLLSGLDAKPRAWLTEAGARKALALDYPDEKVVAGLDLGLRDRLGASYECC
jgi:hypothetical protein